MTTASQAYAAIRSRLEAGAPTALRWQNEDGGPLPDVPAAFAYVEFITDRAFLAAFGGGRSSNRYRHPARVDIYVFVPNGVGLAAASDIAETYAARLRSFRDTDVSCFEATVHPGGSGAEMKPPGLDSEVGNYWWALAEVSLFYDLIG